MSEKSTTRSPLSAGRAIALVARREFDVQVRKKSFLISNAIVLLVIVGGIVAFSIFSGGSDSEDRTPLGLVGDQSLSQTLTAVGDQLGAPVEVREIGSVDEARTQVTDGDVDVALVPGTGGAYTAVTEDTVDGTLKAVIDSAVAAQAQNDALTGLGVDPAAVTSATSAATVTVEAVDPPDPAQGQRLALSFIAVILLYAQIITFGMYVAMGVVEEKSSRVVELLLSTVRPLQLLWGKVIGIGVVGLVQLTAYGAAGLIAGTATGTLTVTGTAVSVFVSTIGWFVLGFAFFAVLYAAGGSMVSRQEDVNSTTMPLLIVILAMFFAAFSSIDDPGATLPTVLSWIPPFSAILMPLRIAAGVADPIQIVGTIVLMIVATLVLAVVAAKIYQRSILRIGRTVSWKEALGRA
ncbi:ABC transporter permease [Rhodococcus sp. BP-349]|uniref:ABC transporter permease n=1 Tax=unclassified Rhodococcus (in: high G+C Gram-positive bacteria) TaxID=192944 RepID=UPI001C9B7AC2|nr:MULTISPECIES: ABC transporter permease [unclassified Rhodococcus (in: high G+C Gram-positive bacteria)]MBY6538245.1 ABC transporter permease [Rhodococcus sp. BP-363]MBY6542582.1 ABC transporter permease [Rhodococcus sp. BP-369]MBY6561812.1 ABC transporter permease [Rhodococcus sp. BP-370]MBY6576104.1 ABC transporter permease [Rhodococcus sp. BP-364]MBY6585405.1 ABC transporter permease [Rhodococcus sp. BP-358]